MADVFSVEKRSEVMSKIRGKNTKAELIAFQYLRQRKIYFQKHYNRAPGKPDIALPRRKIAVFIDGDFWHGHTLEQLKLRREDYENDYWIKKITRNMERDQEQETLLLDRGWKILRVWERDIIRKSTREHHLEIIVAFLAQETR